MSQYPQVNQDPHYYPGAPSHAQQSGQVPAQGYWTQAPGQMPVWGNAAAPHPASHSEHAQYPEQAQRNWDPHLQNSNWGHQAYGWHGPHYPSNQYPHPEQQNQSNQHPHPGPSHHVEQHPYPHPMHQQPPASQYPQYPQYPHHDPQQYPPSHQGHYYQPPAAPYAHAGQNQYPQAGHQSQYPHPSNPSHPSPQHPQGSPQHPQGHPQQYAPPHHQPPLLRHPNNGPYPGHMGPPPYPTGNPQSNVAQGDNTDADDTESGMDLSSDSDVKSALNFINEERRKQQVPSQTQTGLVPPVPQKKSLPSWLRAGLSNIQSSENNNEESAPSPRNAADTKKESDDEGEDDLAVELERERALAAAKKHKKNKNSEQEENSKTEPAPKRRRRRFDQVASNSPPRRPAVEVDVEVDIGVDGLLAGESAISPSHGLLGYVSDNDDEDDDNSSGDEKDYAKASSVADKQTDSTKSTVVASEKGTNSHAKSSNSKVIAKADAVDIAAQNGDSDRTKTGLSKFRLSKR